MKFWYGSGSADSYLRLIDQDPHPAPDLAMFVSDLQDVNKKLFFFLNFISYYILKIHLHHLKK
jgi:hypothetical protein